MARKEHFTLRLAPELLDRLERLAAATGQTKSALAQRLLDEGLRMSAHPSIVFRDGPAGRRPGLSGSHLDVWEIIETVQNEHGDIQAAAAYLCLPPALVSATVDYYLDFRDEIDDWIERNRAMADEAQAQWLRRQTVDCPA